MIMANGWHSAFGARKEGKRFRYREPVAKVAEGPVQGRLLWLLWVNIRLMR